MATILPSPRYDNDSDYEPRDLEAIDLSHEEEEEQEDALLEEEENGPGPTITPTQTNVTDPTSMVVVVPTVGPTPSTTNETWTVET